MMQVPLEQIEIADKCKYWWEKTQSGKNRFGKGGFMITDHAVIDSLMMTDPDAFPSTSSCVVTIGAATSRWPTKPAA